ncbi:MAG: 4-hydroxyacetophenone monooxygenase, partial [Actinomycetota bacterium]|nr:4-hydroxyacetophenone monooxygenase [Actinomycetota bacterium]
QRRLAATTWNSGCKSWYLTEDGYNGTMYPGFANQFVRQMAKVELDDYSMTSPPSPRKKTRARPELVVGGLHGASNKVRVQSNGDSVSRTADGA